jgi:LmbE family N-acetylglucosaminyl deacetylase
MASPNRVLSLPRLYASDAAREAIGSSLCYRIYKPKGISMHPRPWNDAVDSGDVTMLVVRPHPDDESSLTGGMLAYYSARGVSTAVVTCTGGEEGEIHDPDLDPVADFPRLGEIRKGELQNACTILGVSVIRLLGYRDSGMLDTPANQHPEAFCNADPAEAAGRLVKVIRELKPHVMVIEPPGGLYPHPDHVMSHSVGLDAYHAAGDGDAYPEAGPAWQVAKLYAGAQIDDGRWDELLPEFKAAGLDVSWMERHAERPRNPGPETATVALDVAPYTEIQRRALQAHRTQIPADSFWMRLPEDLRRRAFATAYFTRMHPAAAPGEREQDLLDGLDLSIGIG